MRVSIFTPTHDSKYLNDVYNSIKDQDFDEWVIIYNNGAAPIGFSDKRVKEIKVDVVSDKGVGLYKRIACDNCTGDILLELDHDDLLMPDAIQNVREAFQDEKVGFVYSNALYTNMEYGKLQRFDSSNGWVYREVEYNGHLLDEPVSFPPTPASVSRIWYAPDHLRAFRKDIYTKVGGYDVNLVILDDLDLMCRMFQVTEFHHIDKPLYVYRVHGDNAWLRYNKEIQAGVYPIYNKYIEAMSLAWALRNNLDILDLGGRLAHDSRYLSVDLKDADILADLNSDWPFEDNSVGTVRAFDIFEHLRDPLHTMKELYRVLAPGGYAFIQVPSTDGRGAFQDPTHVSFWNENSFLYYTHRDWAKYIDTPVRFQSTQTYTTAKNAQDVCWVVAHLVKLGDSLRIPGIITI